MNMNDPITTLLGSWAIELNIYSILLRVAISVVFAAIIGCERASTRHAAGQRTFILVSLASTMAMMLDKSFSPSNPQIISAAAVIAIAIISSNSILYSSKNQIKGLTTSVALWACSIIGLTTCIWKRFLKTALCTPLSWRGSAHISAWKTVSPS